MGSSAAALHAVAREHRYSVRRPRPSTTSPTSTRLDPLHPPPSTLHPPPSTLHPRPSTLDPRPSTLDLPSSSLASRQVVDLEPGLDLFLVRDDLWGPAAARPRLAPRPLPPFNVQRDGAMRADQQAPRAGG